MFIRFDLSDKMVNCRNEIHKLHGEFYDSINMSIPGDIPVENVIIISGSLNQGTYSSDAVLMWCRDLCGTWYIPDGFITETQCQLLLFILKRLRQVQFMADSHEILKKFNKEFEEFKKEHHADFVRISKETA